MPKKPEVSPGTLTANGMGIFAHPLRGKQIAFSIVESAAVNELLFKTQDSRIFLTLLTILV